MRGRAVGVALLGAATAVGGLALDWPEAVAVGIALALLPFAALALRGPSSARWWDESAPVRVVRGDPAAVVIAVEATGSTRWLSATDAGGTDRAWVPQSSGPTELRWPVDTSRRGLLAVGPATLESGDPFGMHRRVVATRERTPVLVVPRIHDVDVRGALGASAGDDDGEQARGEVFHSLREYVPGDPLNTVHWRSSARTGTLMVRRTVGTTVPWLLVVLDVNARAYDRANALFEDFDAEVFEQAVDLAASWAWHACGPRQRILLTTTARAATAVEVTVRDRESALDWLATANTVVADACGAERVTALARQQGVSRILLVTGAHGGAANAWTGAWRRVRPVTVARP